MIRVMYWWTEDGNGELCALDKIVTEKEIHCDHCDTLIPAHHPAVKLKAVDDTYILHQACALKGCNIHPYEKGMHKRLEQYLFNEQSDASQDC